MNDIKIGVSSSSHETAEDKIVTVTFYNHRLYHRFPKNVLAGYNIRIKSLINFLTSKSLKKYGTSFTETARTFTITPSLGSPTDAGHSILQCSEQL